MGLAFCVQSIRVPLTELQVGTHCPRSQPAAKSKVVWMYEQIFNYTPSTLSVVPVELLHSNGLYNT